MAKIHLDKELIRDLNALLEETGLSEIEINEGRQSIRVARHGGPAFALAPAAPQSANTPSATTVQETQPVEAGAVPSPMVGTVYLSAKPGDPNFVTEGDQVTTGQTLMIIEAMKVMNSIPAPRSGTVKRVFVTDAQPVEFGETLLVLE
ncbi:MAG: acetyl-CoA carboxylase biotin carboxyl carrier protein subunit [Proteobacteria bacterium]|nr:acetyl-CoA carboxylase biotin carboxyl carrier protein subunit [Pseudomonadota bacterium]